MQSSDFAVGGYAVGKVTAEKRAVFVMFEVDELPLYPSSGEGTHLFVTIEKRGLTTQDAIRDIARRTSRAKARFPRRLP